MDEAKLALEKDRRQKDEIIATALSYVSEGEWTLERALFGIYMMSVTQWFDQNPARPIDTCRALANSIRMQWLSVEVRPASDLALAAWDFGIKIAPELVKL